MDSSNDRSIVGPYDDAHAMVHTYELSIPILMTLWLEEFALSKAVLGGIVAVGYGLFGLGAVPGGVLSDRFGSKRLIVGMPGRDGRSVSALEHRAGAVDDHCGPRTVGRGGQRVPPGRARAHQQGRGAARAGLRVARDGRQHWHCARPAGHHRGAHRLRLAYGEPAARRPGRRGTRHRRAASVRRTRRARRARAGCGPGRRRLVDAPRPLAPPPRAQLSHRVRHRDAVGALLPRRAHLPARAAQHDGDAPRDGAWRPHAGVGPLRVRGGSC